MRTSLAVFFLFIISACNSSYRILTAHTWQVDQVVFPESARNNYNEFTRNAIIRQLRGKSSFTFGRDSTLHMVLPTQNVFVKWWLSKDRKKVVVLGQDSVLSETPVSDLSSSRFRFVSRDVGGNDVVFELIPKP